MTHTAANDSEHEFESLGDNDVKHASLSDGLREKKKSTMTVSFLLLLFFCGSCAKEDLVCKLGILLGAEWDGQVITFPKWRMCVGIILLY